MGGIYYLTGLIMFGVAQGIEHGGVVGFSIIGVGMIIIGAAVMIVDYLNG